MGTTQCSVSSPSRTRFHRRKSSETWLAIQRDPGRRWPPGPPWSAAISCCPSRAGSPWATSKGLMPLAPGQGQGDVVGIPIGGGQAGQGGDFQEGRVDSSGRPRCEALRASVVVKYVPFQGEMGHRPLDRKVLDGWRWGLGAARSARMSRSHLVEVGHP